MRRKHNMLLAGVASLALMAGGGIAAAQQSPQGQNNAGAGVSTPSPAQKPSAKPSGAAGAMEQHAQTSSPAGGKASPQAKTDRPSMAQKGTDKAKPENRSAQTEQKSGPGAKQSAQSTQQRIGENAKKTAKNDAVAKQRLGENEKAKPESRERLGRTETKRHERFGTNERMERNRSSAKNEHERSSSMAAESKEHNGELKGLQGNASIPMQGGHANLTSSQRTRIRDTVIDARGAPRVGHVDFDVTVGTVVPRDRIHVVRVPETLVRIDPQWHGYLYFIVEDQVIIVNPRDMRIVAVLDV